VHRRDASQRPSKRKRDRPLDDLLVNVDLGLDLFDERLLVGLRPEAQALHLLDAADDGKRTPEGLLLLVDVRPARLKQAADEQELKELVGILEVLERRAGRDELGRYDVGRSRRRREKREERIAEDWPGSMGEGRGISWAGRARDAAGSLDALSGSNLALAFATPFYQRKGGRREVSLASRLPSSPCWSWSWAREKARRAHPSAACCGLRRGRAKQGRNVGRARSARTYPARSPAIKLRSVRQGGTRTFWLPVAGVGPGVVVWRGGGGKTTRQLACV